MKRRQYTKEEDTATTSNIYSASSVALEVSSLGLLLLQYFLSCHFTAVSCLPQSGRLLNSER
jgi:hypothetical protein